ncbi:MAG TPA: hypothetical protein VHT91_31770 [Kofleriaceae bacterium]|jgi:hypothetical protein|nr:hypothetical protein [Kofleriaceae bacterium]
MSSYRYRLKDKGKQMAKRIPANPKADHELSDFDSQTHDQPKSLYVLGITMATDDIVTASITAGIGLFKILVIDVGDWIRVEFDPNEFPHHKAPPPEWRAPEVGRSDGVVPLPVKRGQLLSVEIVAQVPEHALPPGPFTGTLHVQGATFSRTVSLRGNYLAVDENTPIGQKWRQLGGEAAVGSVLSNAHFDPAVQAVIQDFDRGAICNVPGAGAFFLSSLVLAKWKSVTAAGDDVRAATGLPIEDVFAAADRSDVQRFQTGAIVVRPSKEAFAVHGAIYQDYREFGDLPIPGRQPRLGLPLGDEQPIVGGRLQTFDSGDIWWSPGTGAHEIHGDIRNCFMKLGGMGSQGFLGWPLTDEMGAPDGIGRANRFQGGAIYWTPTTGAHAVHGAILDRWSALGFERSYLGYPIADEADWIVPGTTAPGGRQSTFQRGQIVWTPQNGTFDVPETYTPPTAPVVTPAGTALGGSVTFTLRSNGTYAIQYYMEDSGLPGYDFTVRAIFVTSNGLSFAGQHSGHVGGTLTTGARDDHASQEGSNSFIQRYWEEVKAGTLFVTKDYSTTGVIGFIEDVAKAVLDIVVTAGAFTLGVVIWLGSEIGQIFGDLGLGGTMGLIAGVVVFACGGGIVLAGLSGIAVGQVTNLMIKQRPLRHDEIAFVNRVFNGVLPTDRIVLTNLSGLGGRAFTCPGADKQIYVNIGSDAYDNPTEYINRSSYPTKGEVLIHELTHAWQIEYGSFVPALVCEGIVNQANNTFGQSVYVYGPPSSPWSSFNLEAQAAIVDQWFGGIATVNAPLRTPEHSMDGTDPYFPYIQNNLRAKVT